MINNSNVTLTLYIFYPNLEKYTAAVNDNYPTDNIEQFNGKEFYL